jgi:predicted ABC-type ATPase
MPTLYILAGPNGAGKTTFYNTAIEQNFIPSDLPFLNIDLITRELGSYSDFNFAKAEEIYRERITKLLQQGANFMIESNLAKDAEYEWIEAMIRKGYEVVLYFLCTDYIDDVHINRVQKRVKEGGHYVPPNIIEHRYKMSLLYLRSKLTLFKEVYLIDNNETTLIKVVLRQGSIMYKEAECPAWIKKVIFIAERLRNKSEQ